MALKRVILNLYFWFVEGRNWSRGSGSGNRKYPKSSWWFQIFFIFTPTWGIFPI